VVGSEVRRLRQTFTRALFAGDPEAAERAISEAMDAGLTAAEIDIELIAPALFMVGDKWATGEISVADEHLASEITLRVLALQRERRRAQRSRRSRRVLLLAPQGERHVIGLNMACDLLYAAGYDTRMLGADVPLADIAPAVARLAPDIIALTATMPDSAERLDATIDYLSAAARHIPVVLGGTAVSFEVAATWNAAVCRDVSTVVETVDALSQRAPLN
jgi:methanogenic corrinoid protein MtbC1